MLAHALTSLRLLLVAPMVWLLLAGPWPGPALLLLILLAILTDYFDGIAARRLGTASPGGMLFDHGTDFLFVTGGLFAAAFMGLVTLVLPILIVFAFTQYVLDSYFLFHQKTLRMSFLGRWNGIFYFVPLLLIAVSQLSVLDEASYWLLVAAHYLGLGLVVSTLVSIVDRALAPRRERHNS